MEINQISSSSSSNLNQKNNFHSLSDIGLNIHESFSTDTSQLQPIWFKDRYLIRRCDCHEDQTKMPAWSYYEIDDYNPTKRDNTTALFKDLKISIDNYYQVFNNDIYVFCSQRSWYLVCNSNNNSNSNNNNGNGNYDFSAFALLEEPLIHNGLDNFITNKFSVNKIENQSVQYFILKQIIKYTKEDGELHHFVNHNSLDNYTIYKFAAKSNNINTYNINAYYINNILNVCVTSEIFKETPFYNCISLKFLMDHVEVIGGYRYTSLPYYIDNITQNFVINSDSIIPISFMKYSTSNTQNLFKCNRLKKYNQQEPKTTSILTPNRDNDCNEYYYNCTYFDCKNKDHDIHSNDVFIINDNNIISNIPKEIDSPTKTLSTVVRGRFVFSVKLHNNFYSVIIHDTQKKITSYLNTRVSSEKMSHFIRVFITFIKSNKCIIIITIHRSAYIPNKLKYHNLNADKKKLIKCMNINQTKSKLNSLENKQTKRKREEYDNISNIGETEKYDQKVITVMLKWNFLYSWKRKRLLYIAFYKNKCNNTNDNICFISFLPIEIIRIISKILDEYCLEVV